VEPLSRGCTAEADRGGVSVWSWSVNGHQSGNKLIEIEVFADEKSREFA
jgi:hypothetical protein